MECIPVYYLLVRTTFLRQGGDWHPVTDTWSQPRPLSKTILKFQVYCPDSVLSLWNRDAASSIVKVQSYTAFWSSLLFMPWHMTSKALHYWCISLSATPSYFGKLPVWWLKLPWFVGCCYYLDWPIRLFLAKYGYTYFARSRLIGQSRQYPLLKFGVVCTSPTSKTVPLIS